MAMTASGAGDHGQGWLAAVVVGLILATSGAASAQEPAQTEPAIQASDLTPAQAAILRLGQEAEALFQAGDYAGSQARLEELAPLMAEMFGPTSLGMAELRVHLGDALRAQSRHADAVAAYAAALEIREALRQQPPQEIEAILFSLAGSHWAAGQLAEAASNYQRAAFIRENVLGPRHTATADALLNFSRVELARGRIVTALQSAEKAWSIQAEVWGERSIQATEALSALGAARLSSGRWTEAELDLRRVVELRQSLTPDDEVGLANALGDLGAVLDELGRYAEAEPLHLQALDIQRRVWGPSHANVWWALNDYANAMHSRTRANQPEEAFRRIAARGGGTPTSETADDREIRARFAAVEGLYRDALAIARAGHGPRSPQTGTSLANLANVLASQGRFAESEPLTREAIDIFDELYGLNHPNLASARDTLGDTLRSLRRYEEALDQHKWAGVIAQVLYGAEHAVRAEIYNDVGIDQLMMGDVVVGTYSLEAATAHRMSLVCPAADRNPTARHPWSYADPDCAGHPDFTGQVAAFAAVRTVFEDRPAASLRMISHAGDMVLGRTRVRYALFEDARVEANRFAYVHRQFVSGAWAVADPTARRQQSEDLSRFYWPFRGM